MLNRIPIDLSRVTISCRSVEQLPFGDERINLRVWAIEAELHSRGLARYATIHVTCPVKPDLKNIAFKTVDVFTASTSPMILQAEMVENEATGHK